MDIYLILKYLFKRFTLFFLGLYYEILKFNKRSFEVPKEKDTELMRLIVETGSEFEWEYDAPGPAEIESIKWDKTKRCWVITEKDGTDNIIDRGGTLSFTSDKSLPVGSLFI